MTSTKPLPLTEILELAGDIPAEGILNVLGKVAYKAKGGKLDLLVSPEQVASLYDRFQSNEEVERTFSYLFARAGDRARAADAYYKLITFLVDRRAYGMAGDAAMEAYEGLEGMPLFRSKAGELYGQQIEKMDKQRSSDSETSEYYYDEMLLKAGRLGAEGRLAQYQRRSEERVKDYLQRGFFPAQQKFSILWAGQQKPRGIENWMNC